MARSTAGYFLVHRKLFRPGSDLYGDGHAIAVFTWLIGHANWVDSKKPLRKQRVILKRGQVATSLREMADGTGFERNTVSRVLKRLVEANIIRTEREHSGTIVTLLKYDEYQATSDEEETESEQQTNSRDASRDATHDATPDADQKNTYKKYKNISTQVEGKTLKKKAKTRKERLTTWEPEDEYAICFEHLREVPKYWEIFDREVDRKKFDKHRQHYGLSLKDLEQVTYDFHHWCETPRGQAMQAPRLTLANFVKNHAERKAKNAPQDNRPSLFEIYGVSAKGAAQ